MMSPVCRMYRSGKNILIRVNIESSKHNGQAKCIAYNEDETLVEINSLQQEQNIIPLIRIDGIKFTARSFEISIYLHQFMILNKEEDLEANKKCMISLDYQKENIMGTELLTAVDPNKVESKITFEDSEKMSDSTLSKKQEELNSEKHTSLGENSTVVESSSITEENVHSETNESTVNQQQDNCDDKNVGDNENTNNDTNDPDNVAEIEEISLDVSNNNDSIQLKKSSEVYYEIYKDAKKKARAMREAALKAYLEAEKIKMKFSLDDICDDESDFDDSEQEDSDTSSVVDNVH